MKKKKKSGGKPKTKSQRRALKLGIVLVLLLGLWGVVGEWFVHHPRKWLDRKYATYPKFVTVPLFFLGNPLGDLTDALGWTGHDAVYEYDTEAPSGSVAFAGYPRRVREPEPSDLRVLSRGEFTIGWSDSLKHPLWVAYHVVKKAKHAYDGKRPNFSRDRYVPAAPTPGDYAKSGYDRGHMAPNFAMVTRYGEETQKKTFLMSNIAPQTPSLNRGPWRDVEHRIAELWTARYGEIWVVAGAVPSSSGRKTPSGIDIPDAYYQIVITQENMDVRALAVLLDQHIPYRAYPARHLITIDELEELTGLDFNPELPSFIQSPLESELPSRLWPIRAQDVLKLFFK